MNTITPLQLQTHVEALAGIIGERNVFHPMALFRYPFYHTAEDTPDKLDYLAFAEVANGLFLMLSAEC